MYFLFHFCIYTVSITIDKDTGYEWTSDGLSVTPEIDNFDYNSNVKITYTWEPYDELEDNYQRAENANRTNGACACCFGNSEDPGDGNQTHNILLLPLPYTSKPFSGPPPHVLSEHNISGQGVLIAVADDENYQARCQINIKRGMYM